MRIEWLKKNNSRRVILFFHGWGMDSQSIAHLQTDAGLLLCSDYRNIGQADFPVFEDNTEICVVAWSMGIWAAANVLPQMNIRPSKLIGLNGTEFPVDDVNGIPVRIYELTEKGMNEKGRIKFMQRMFDCSEEWERFGAIQPQRPLDDVCEELMLIHRQSHGLQNKLNWDKIYISGKDLIFPVANQKNWWQDKCPDIRILSGGHYPFYQFESWEEIIGG